MRKILILITFLVTTSYFLNAQNSFIINTTGNTFSPDTLTITVGDTVTWNNTQGFHNINATLATYPVNPEGFGNSVAGAGWSFQWIFTIPGTYDYQCDPHAGIGMTGVIIANPFCDPYDLSVDNINTTGATLSWSSANATAFSVKWRIAGSTTSWASSDPNIHQTLANIFVDTLLFDTLNSNTTYEWRVRSYGCTPTTNWWDGPNFTTISSTCNKSLDQELNGFNPDPVYALWVWSYDTLSITNTGNCDLRIRPEFDISHESLTIGTSDFDLKWHNPLFGIWVDIPYYIDANGNAVGFWGFGADSTGTQITQGSLQQIIIKIRFRPNANFGTYSANWTTQEVDSSGNFVQTLTIGDSTSISLIDCSIFNIDSSYSSDITCFNDNNGSASIASIQNGSNEYLYYWSNGDTTNTINNLQEGNYYCIVTDKNWQQCSDSIGFTISEPAELSATANIINVICYGDSNGVATLNINGGTSPYTEAWNGGSQYNLQAGDYYYTLTDSNSCTFSDSVHIYQPSQLNSSISSLDITNCGSNDGIINLSVSGGTGTYSYIWSTNDTTEDLGSLSSGTYSVTITDINNCSATNSATINNFNSTLTTSLSSPTYNGYHIQCFGGSNGSISSNTNGGVGSLTYNWSNGQNTSIDTNLSAGLYSLIVTDSLNCTVSDSIILSEPNELTSTYTQTNVSCYSSNDGGAIVDFFGGTSGSSPGDTNYILGWAGTPQPIYLPYPQTFFNTSLLPPPYNAIPAGTFPYTVTDLNGCIIYDTITITEPDSLYITYTLSNNNGYNVSCFGDNNATIEIQFNGGTSPFDNYLNNTLQTGLISNNLSAGNYTDSIVDLYGCTANTSINLNQPSQLNSSISSLDITNCGSNDGIINLSVSGGTGTYSYIWSTNDTTEDLGSLSSGTYSVTITDINNCSATNSATINNFNSTLTTSLSSPTYNGYHIQCFGGSNGSISSNTNGGVGSLTYNWSNGQNTSIDTNLSAGLYSLIVTDSLNCTVSDSIILSEPNELTSTYTQTNVSCYSSNDGGAIVDFFGGTSGSSPGDTNYILGWAGTPQPIYLPYPQTFFNTSLLPPPYNAIPAGTFPYTVTDLNGCIIYDTITITEPDSLYITYTLSNNNGYNVSCFGDNNATIEIQFNGGTSPFDNYLNNTLQTGLISNNLSAGNYTDSIVDLYGCTANTSINLNQPSQLNITLNTIDISCYDLCDGEIYSNTSGGVIPYNYLWSNNQTTVNISTLCAGNYSLILTDQNGCIENASTIINAPNAISVSTDSTLNISNYGGNSGFIYITTNGGSGLLNTNWTSTNNYSSTNNDIINLYADIYYLEVIDSNLCSFLDTFELSQPSSLGISINTITSPSCYDSCNGAINITAYGGDSTYSYLWIGPNGFTSNNDNINTLCYGEYIIIIDDGITNLIDTINIYQPQPITTLLSVDSIICHNGTAQAEINVWGGSQPFTYSWSNGDTNHYTIVNSGNHSIDISDINGCAYAHSFSLTDPDSIFTQTTSTSTSCFGGNNGTISINITNGGISPYNFSNDNGLNYQISNTFTNLLAGNYSFLISDINGCLGSASAEVIEPSAIISTTTAIDASCFSYCNGSVTATALGGTSPYSYIWANGSSNLCAGFYNVIVTDLNGCIGSNSAIVNEPNPLLINVWIDGSNIIATSGFTSYQWYDNNNDPINGANDSIFTPSSIGVYYVTVTDTNACSADSYYIEYTISTIEDYTLNINIFPNPTNGNITINSLYGIKTIKLYNSIGNELYSVNNKENSITETKIDLSTFAKGVYFIKININNQIINQRIILQ